MPRFRLTVAALAGVLAVEAVILLIGGIMTGRWVWAVLPGVLAACAALDFLAIRKRPGPGWNAGGRVHLAFVGLAVGMAIPTLGQLWAWLR